MKPSGGNSFGMAVLKEKQILFWTSMIMGGSVITRSY